MNSKPKVFLTRRILQAGIDLLQTQCEVSIFPYERLITIPELIENVHDADALLCMLTDPIDDEVIRAASHLKVISNFAVGYNNINIEAAKNHNIIVTNTPGVLTETTAETAFALMIACARRITESDRWIRTHNFDGWAPMLFLGHDLYRKTLGIIGLGRIGKAFARRASRGFDMKILYLDKVRDTEFEKEYDARCVTKQELLQESDFISIHTPLTAETKHFIGEKEFSMMKTTACLINTARGPIVDEKALIEALQNKKIFSAGLDVFEDEPFIPKELIDLDNVVILPHIGSASVETRTKMSVMAAENIISVLNGEEPHSRVT